MKVDSISPDKDPNGSIEKIINCKAWLIHSYGLAKVGYNSSYLLEYLLTQFSMLFAYD